MSPWKKEQRPGKKRGATVIYAAVNGEAAGFAALTDTERAGIRDMVTELKAGSVPPCF